jgi:hypothetical protein
MGWAGGAHGVSDRCIQQFGWEACREEATGKTLA